MVKDLDALRLENDAMRRQLEALGLENSRLREQRAAEAVNSEATQKAAQERLNADQLVEANQELQNTVAAKLAAEEQVALLRQQLADALGASSEKDRRMQELEVQVEVLSSSAVEAAKASDAKVKELSETVASLRTELEQTQADLAEASAIVDDDDDHHAHSMPHELSPIRSPRSSVDGFASLCTRAYNASPVDSGIGHLKQFQFHETDGKYFPVAYVEMGAYETRLGVWNADKQRFDLT
jgi:hypothetical protein